MERLTRNTFIVAGVFGIIGTAFLVSRKSEPPEKTEKDMQALVPDVVAGWPYHRDSKDPEISYTMDKGTYDLLQPFGIVARTYWKGSREYDVVVIASRSKDSFHDPRVCFSAQGWTVEDFKYEVVDTESRGTVPVSLITMSKDSQGQSNKLAAFFYKAPAGQFYADTRKFKFGLWKERFEAMLKGQILNSSMNLDGVFYRIIPKHNTTPEELKKFIALYLDASNESSKGYF